ncbi:hypothetical protein [Bradyrhizobium sp. SZCCHNR3015]|uniref:hypothetical protein n=1 Tax=Bradyrhizobium sp. SZCCHNR3015 TaxID=3057395 RepID=UPI0029169AC5|nr:hypothetical protein [Bradyrhizobium sp. SZCCHNR3015]
MSDHSLEDIVLGIIERWHAGRYSERHGLVTSYDPDKHLAKVMFQPEGQESGWLPIETAHIGDGYGMAVGLQPGDGKTTGDQVVVRFQEGDFEGGKIVQRVHSDDQKPPRVESGEMVLWTRFQKSSGGKESAQGAQGGIGQRIYFKNDGSIVITDGNGATVTVDGHGNVRITCNDFSVVASGDVGIKAQKTTEITSADTTGIDAGNKVVVKGQGDVGSDGSVTRPQDQPVQPPFEVQ